MLITLDDIFGQDEAVKMLRADLKRDRLPHAMIFAGPVGVGKATTAAAVAAAFLCEQPKGAIPCGKCEACRLMASKDAVHPDYHVVYRTLRRLTKPDAVARDLAVDVVREYLVEPANRTSVRGRGKVFVIEEAELMNTEAQNALLKTLEEPPRRTVVIAITNRPHALLPTVRSRCRLMRFSPLDKAVVQRELAKRGISETDAADAARYSDGSLGLALRWAEDGVVAAARQLERMLDALLRGQRVAELSAWLREAAKAYAKLQLKRDEKASEDQLTREGTTLYLGTIARLLRKHLAEEADADACTAMCDAIEAVVLTEQYVDANVGVPLALLQLDSSLERLLVRA